MTVFIAFVVWAALLYGLTAGAKVVGRLVGISESPPFVRALPLIPFVIGGITGTFVLPAFAAELGMLDVAALPLAVFPPLGFGAGGVAGSAYKILNQTILGKDRRLVDGVHLTKVEIDPEKFRAYMESQNGRRNLSGTEF